MPAFTLVVIFGTGMEPVFEACYCHLVLTMATIQTNIVHMLGRDAYDN